MAPGSEVVLTNLASRADSLERRFNTGAASSSCCWYGRGIARRGRGRSVCSRARRVGAKVNKASAATSNCRRGGLLRAGFLFSI